MNEDGLMGAGVVVFRRRTLLCALCILEEAPVE